MIDSTTTVEYRTITIGDTVAHEATETVRQDHVDHLLVAINAEVHARRAEVSYAVKPITRRILEKALQLTAPSLDPLKQSKLTTANVITLQKNLVDRGMNGGTTDVPGLHSIVIDAANQCEMSEIDVITPIRRAVTPA